MTKAMETNNEIIDAAEANGVRSYIFVPCIVYGEGEGFGKRISIQTTAIVQAAKSLRKVFRTDAGSPVGSFHLTFLDTNSLRQVWPVCHVLDTTSLYLRMLEKITEGEDIGHGRDGYFLAASGHIAWNDLYSAMAKRMADLNVISTEAVEDADDTILERMGQALGCPKDYVSLQLGGEYSTLRVTHESILTAAGACSKHPMARR